MNYQEFVESLESGAPPTDCEELLVSLWWDGKGDWNKSHKIAQDVHTTDGSWVHAYLHRKEGDEWNAGYWYRQAGRPFSKLSLDEEWRELVSYFLE